MNRNAEVVSGGQAIRPFHTRRGQFTAFTLAEMLIVIGIVALLMALLLPSVGRVREQANLALCQNNMKKLYDVFSLAGVQKDASPNDLPSGDGWIGFVEKQNCMANLVCPLDDKKEGKSAGDPSGGIIRFLPEAPSSAYFGQFESNSQLTCFRERSAYPLPASISVDLLPTGGPGAVPGGTPVDSFFLIFDPSGRSSASISGTISFSGEILGVIYRAGLLNQSDSIVGAPKTSYPSSVGGRGMESGQGIITISSDRQTMVINGMYSGGVGEQVRVIVSQGGMASYAMNKWAGGKWGRSDQILLIEYKKAVANLDTAGSPPDDLAYWLAPRHRRKLNVLYNHGGFEILTASDLIRRTKRPIEPGYARDWKR